MGCAGSKIDESKVELGDAQDLKQLKDWDSHKLTIIDKTRFNPNSKD